MWREKLTSGAKAPGLNSIVVARVNSCPSRVCPAFDFRTSRLAAIPGQLVKSVSQDWYRWAVHLRYSTHTTFMPREITAFPLSLPAPPARGNLYRWLYGELRAAILDGRLRPGSRLPATRDLAAAYRLSRSTIVTAFEQLKSEGYVEGRSGSGTYVSEVLPEHLLDVRGPKPEKRLPHRRIALSAYARRLQPFRGTAVRPMRAFRPNQPALDLFPTDLWAQVAARRLRRVSANLLAGGEALGYRPLREAVAAYLNSSRGVKCTAEQVLILSGAQEALDRTARILLNPRESVWMEEPGYPGAGVVFRAGRF